MSIIIDRLFTEPKVYNGFQNNEQFYKNYTIKKYINVSNFFPAIISMIILRLFNTPTYIVITIALIVYLYTTYINIMETHKKVEFLNSIIYDGNEEPFENESFLELDPKIVDFYYKNRWYIDYNLTSYRKSLEASNNLLRITHNLKNNLMRDPEQLYENAYIEYKEALNNLHSSIYKMISQTVNDDIFNDNLTILKTLLHKHIFELQKYVIKCGYNKYNINISSIINPTNIEYKDDTKTKTYSPHYSFF